MLTTVRHIRHAGLEGEELLAALDADAKARTLGELVADLQPLLHATATPDGPKARGLFAAARFLAGYTSYLMGQAEPALACMRLSTAWWGAPAGWHYMMAQIAAAAGELTEAEYAYAAAIERDPQHRSAYIELMGLLSDRGDMAACRKLAAQAIAQSPPVHWTNEWQRPDHMLAGLRASAWHDPAEFPWCAMLEANAAVIRAELLAVVRSQRRRQERLQNGWEAVGTHQRAEFGTDRTLVSEGGSWREFVLLGEPDDDPEDQEARMMGGDPIGGVVEANCRRCPRTAALLRSIPAVVSLAEVDVSPTHTNYQHVARSCAEPIGRAIPVCTMIRAILCVHTCRRGSERHCFLASHRCAPVILVAKLTSRMTEFDELAYCREAS
jgi:hypothetical protein